MKPYEQYKHSGIDWLGQVPSHWEVKRIVSLFVERRQKVSDKDFPALSVTKLGVFPQWENVAKTDNGDNRKLVRKGDFVINSRSDRKGSSGIAPKDGSVSLINIVLQPKNIDSQYIQYLLKSYNFIEEFYRVGHGIVADLWTTRFDDIKNSLIAIPPLPEQLAIAKFLDEKTAQIQMAIGIKNKQIAKLKEYRQALINQTVTKGLNANTPMKNSGVEWLGEVPSHWEVKKLKYVLQLSNEKTESQKSDLRYIGMENIVSNTGELTETILEAEGVANIFHQNEILFGKLRPYLAKVYLAQMDGICSTEFLVYKTSKQIFNKFAFYLMICPNFIETVNSSTYGTKMPRANSDFLANLSIPIPPLPEQLAIAEFLDKKTAQIDKAIAHHQNQIERLKEYQQSLVNDVVMGKMRIKQD